MTKVKKIKVECCGEEKPSSHSLDRAICRLIKYLGDKTIIPADDDCKDKNGNSDLTLTIILQDDEKRLESCRRLLDNPDDIEKRRFLFLQLDDRYDQRYHFWEKILCNIGAGTVVDIGSELQKNTIIASEIAEKIEEICHTNDSGFIRRIMERLACLDNKLPALKKNTDTNNSNFYLPFIDEIDSPRNLQHGGWTNEKELLPYSHLREALIDWTGQNKWVFSDDLEFLILDDVMWEVNWPNEGGDKEREQKFKRDLLNLNECAEMLSGKKWKFFRLLKPNKKIIFKNYIQTILDGSEKFLCKAIEKNCASDCKAMLTHFTHILVDWKLDESGKYSGLNLVRDLKAWFNKNLEKAHLMPEILILTRNPDPVTIEAALEAGASGYVLKDNIAELPYIVGRVGRPLKPEERDEIDSLLTDSFPSLKSFPAFVPKALYLDEWKKVKKYDPPENRNTSDDYYEKSISTVRERVTWLRSIPKTDLHVHFGTTIPLDICYDLAIISVYRWACQYCDKEHKGNEDKWEQLKKTAKLIEEILNRTAFKIKNERCEEKENSNNFRNCYLEAFKEITKIYEVVTVNNTIKRLNRRFDKLSEEQIACLVVTALGSLYGRYDGNLLDDRIKEIKSVCDDIEKIKDNKNPLLSFYLQDSTRIIEYIKGCYNGEDKTVGNQICDTVNRLFDLDFLDKKSFNPLSCLLSISEILQESAQGLPKYLGAGDLVGASLLQFAETLLLASYHIPIWASEQNVWHQELRAGPTGYLKGLNNPTIATKIMMLGLYTGIKAVKHEHPDKHPTTSVLITAKRHKDKEDIKKSVFLATEFVTKNENDVNDTAFKNFVPKVLGMDLAGIERGYLPEDLVEQFRESFRRCLMMTVHAGEDESVESIWQAVYSLHASRIGHCLRLDEHKDLKRLFKDRQICVELCPKSNQFTNGYTLYRKNKKDEESKKAEDLFYVFEDYWKYRIPLTINTDNPLISHRPEIKERQNTEYLMEYPLSEEYLALPHLLGSNNKKDKNESPLFINRLLILKLIYNGFKYSFLSPKEKARSIEYADREVFNVLAAEFLDVYISAER